MATSTVENYLKTLFQQQQRTTGRHVAMGKLARAMNVTPGTATSMIKTLAESGLVDYRPRQGVRLTQRGETLALHVLRRHRLIEVFLVNFLGLDWAEVHEEAEELEHAISDKVMDRIDAMLGHPSVDPHGDPIPDAAGRMRTSKPKSLADIAVGSKPLTLMRVLDQRKPFLEFLRHAGLTPGTRLTLEQRDDMVDAVVIRVGDREPITLGLTAAAKILVESA
ncbi:MAG: metal-dependent transcriptional regulator [Phycisphaeraceae bacterium]|nr:metal-dependent transcriptional regulator [Phycisphaeraceae bacterium]